MDKLTLGLVGYGNVGSGVRKFIESKKSYLQEKFQIGLAIKMVCEKDTIKLEEENFKGIQTTTNYQDLLNDPEIDVIIELVGGLEPARDIVLGALQKKKHVITANKELLAHYGKLLFREAYQNKKNIYFESSVMAGVPVIKSITEGIAGNQFLGLYGIINGTCNYILTEMTRKKLTFAQALKEAQKNGFAEANPVKDISGLDSTHKLAVLVALTLGKFLKVESIHTEGITDISHDDIEHAESLGLTIKLLAIAKRVDRTIEARVHPTLISKNHPLASVNGIYNAIFVESDPLGKLMFSGEGAGQMAAASGVVSDLINLAARRGARPETFPSNFFRETPNLRIKKIDQIMTRYYIRFNATDKPGVLSKIAGVLGRHGISINSVTQKVHGHTAKVPVVMLTDYAPEKMIRLALQKIHKMPIIKSKPVAIRMENLK